MWPADQDLADRLAHPADRALVEHLLAEHPSGHSDLTDVLLRSADDLGGWRAWCPEPAAYSYEILVSETSGAAFGLAEGMQALMYRCPDDLVDGRLERVRDVVFGNDWVRVMPWDAEVPREDIRSELARWCRYSLEHASRL